MQETLKTDGDNTIKQEEVKEVKPEEKPVDIGEGSVEKTANAFDRADKTVKELASENDRMEKNIARLEQLRARELLGGSSEGGAPTETPKDILEKKMQAEIDNLLIQSGLKPAPPI